MIGLEQSFDVDTCGCLRWAERSARSEEQTQEVRLPDAMPDIGRVLCAWGQPLIRGKEWRGGGMSVSGGVMAWVLYAPEDGSGAQVVESWLPFQVRWDFPEQDRDGTVRASCLLRSVDARSVSARKLMVRACVSVLGEALVPGKAEVSRPGEMPPDVQVLERSYPVRIPKEAGEKSFLLDEELLLPASAPAMEAMVYCTVQPELIDQKLMGDKVVFRGAALVHLLYRGEEGGLKAWDFEVPFSQYADLEQEYDPNAAPDVALAVTSLELEQGDGGSLRLKAGLTGQYLIYGRELVHTVEDAYSPAREVQVRAGSLSLPAVLDESRETLHLEQTADASGGQIVDVFFCTEHPAALREGDGICMTVPGTFQVLYYDENGALQSTAAAVQAQWKLPCGENGRAYPRAVLSGTAKAAMGGGVNLRCDVAADAIVMAEQGIPMVTGLELGEL